MSKMKETINEDEATLIAKEIALIVLSDYPNYPSIVDDLDLSDEALEELCKKLEIDLNPNR